MTAVLTYYEAAEFGSIVQIEVTEDMGSFVVTRQGKRRPKDGQYSHIRPTRAEAYDAAVLECRKTVAKRRHELENAEVDLQRMEAMKRSQ